jgi:beta-lactamase class D
MKYWFVFQVLLIPFLMPAQVKTVNIEKYFKGNNGAIIIYNQASKEYIRYNEARCKERFSPASTFKILNSLIGLETGVIPDENYIIKWDGIKMDAPEWNRDHTLASSIKYSVVPYYRELARRVGKERIQSYIDKTGYGNGEKIINNTDNFWLDNSLKISAEEQIDFLQRFNNYKLPFSKRAVDVVKKIMPEEAYANSKLKFKAGTNKISETKYIGWLVGYVAQGQNVYYFAFNIDADSYAAVKKLRDEIPVNILKHLKIII